MNIIDVNTFNQIIKQFDPSKKILVIGDVGVDKYTQGEVVRISPEAPVPVVEVTKEWKKLGLAANISHNLTTLNVDSLILGVIGDDSNASVFETLLEDNQLKTWGIVRDNSRPTIFKERITTSTQQICRIDYENSSPIDKTVEKNLSSKFSDFIDDYQAVIIEDYSKGTLSDLFIQELIKKCNEKNILVSVDPGKQTSPHVYTGATLLKPNLVEAKKMVKFLGHAYQKMSLEEIGDTLQKELNIKYLVITLGKDGMALWDGKNICKKIPTLADEVFDVSGAGDTSISLLTLSLICNASLEEAAWVANCGAGVVVAKKGTATVNKDELLRFYKRLTNNL